MKHEAVARLRFSKELREKWPTTVLTAEAQSEGGPWSMRAELWSPPDDDGTALAWVTFLSPDAPVKLLESQPSFDVTLGRTIVATCSLCPSMADIESADIDFLESPERGLRAAETCT